MKGSLHAAVFLDRDGTLMHDVNYCSNPDDVVLFPATVPSLQRLRAAGFLLVIVTNQSGIGRGYLTQQDFRLVQERLLSLIGPDLIAATYFAPDHPNRATMRRKPGSGMLEEAASDLAIDLGSSYLVGDNSSDIEAGRRAGLRASIRLASSSSEPGTVADLAEATDYILADSATFR